MDLILGDFLSKVPRFIMILYLLFFALSEGWEKTPFTYKRSPVSRGDGRGHRGKPEFRNSIQTAAATATAAAPAGAIGQRGAESWVGRQLPPRPGRRGAQNEEGKTGKISVEGRTSRRK